MPLKRDGEKWSREEHVLAFNLYCKIPFGRIHHNNREIVQLANLLGRSPSSTSMKLSNFARLDPSLQARGVRGMPHGAKGEGEVWEEFADHPEALAFESEQLLAIRLGKNVEEVAEVDTRDLPPAGRDREALVRVRVNQSFFRSRILSTYDYRCCVTGLALRPLLVASHIIPWSDDPANRLNPRNGLCLNALHDRAFDRGLMFVDESLHVRFSAQVREESSEGAEWLLAFDGRALILPPKFVPDAALLVQHRERWQLAA